MADVKQETVIRHCTNFYNKLDEVSLPHKLESGKKVKRFVGKVTDVYVMAGITKTYYTLVFKVLERNDAIIRVQRGGRSTDTVIVLLGLPTTWDLDLGGKGLTTTTRSDKLALEIQEIKESLGGMNVIKALEFVDKKLKEQDKKIKALEKKLDSLINV